MIKRFILVSSILFTSSAFAQNFTTEDYQAAIQTLQAQRDAANNQIVDFSIRYGQLQRENARLQNELKEKDKKND
jgi:predicted  nucleic acid-binding Zn-ribbon protein